MQDIGFPDGGAIGINGTIESEINLKIALKIQKLIEESGNTCIMTRKDENGISGLTEATIRRKHVEDLKNRVKIAKESNADAFVSIHLNRISQEQYNGWQSFYKKGDEKSKILADSIQKSIQESVKRDNKREIDSISDIYIVKNINIPITIVECGFISNNEEEKMLNTEEYQEKLAQGIFNGIMKYLSNEKI